MKLFLIRHGETVDNVAGLYAGTRDSALTNHGVLQARKLGQYFFRENVRFTHIFASPLSRAFKTAQAVHDAQNGIQPDSEESREVTASSSTAPGPTSTVPPVPEIVTSRDLMEQDFGSFEGKPFYETFADGSRSNYLAHSDYSDKDRPGYVPVETREAMAKRAEKFLDEYLVPVFAQAAAEHKKDTCNPEKITIAVVSHGMLLSTLWKRLLLRLPRRSITVAAEVVERQGRVVLEHLGGWVNTGYLELELGPGPALVKKVASGSDAVPAEQTAAEPSPEETQVTLDNATVTEMDNAEGAVTASLDTTAPDSVVSMSTASQPQSLEDWRTTIVAINRRDHLYGLKRQHGGIGSAKHDENQQTVTKFFKRRKSEV